MKWITDYQLFLFDFDGLLVNTEEIHFRAYQRMCGARGYKLPWDFAKYCMMAHYDSTKLRESIYADLPELYQKEPNWEVLYEEKKDFVIDLLHNGAVHLMPGADELLKLLSEKGVTYGVVTNSPKEQIQIIKDYNPQLKTIPHWFTRETYQHPKPNPECYLNAIKELGGDSVIGFEDTPRGIKALLQTPAKPILITQISYPEIPDFISQGVEHFQSLNEFLDNQS